MVRNGISVFIMVMIVIVFLTSQVNRENDKKDVGVDKGVAGAHCSDNAPP